MFALPLGWFVFLQYEIKSFFTSTDLKITSIELIFMSDYYKKRLIELKIKPIELKMHSIECKINLTELIISSIDAKTAI